MNIQAMIHPWLCDCHRTDHLPSTCNKHNHTHTHTHPRKTRPLPHRRHLHRARTKPSRHCLLPVQRTINYGYHATKIQTIWRGWRGQLLAEIRHFQLAQLQERARSTFFYNEMSRLQQVFLEWHRVMSEHKQWPAILLIQSCRRGYLARLYVKRKRTLLAFLLQHANQRRLLYCVQLWKNNVDVLQRIRCLTWTLHRYKNVVRVRVLLRNVLLYMYCINRTNVLARALQQYYLWMLCQRTTERKARLTIALRRWNAFTAMSKKNKHRSKKTVFRYWKALVVLVVSRRHRHQTATMVQSLFRGWFARTLKYRAARTLQCFVRMLLANVMYSKAYYARMRDEMWWYWREMAPVWKTNRINREKRKLYRNAVRRRHQRRARKGKASPVSASFEEVFIGMEQELRQRDIDGVNAEYQARIYGVLQKMNNRTLNWVFKHWQWTVSVEFKELKKRKKKMREMKGKMKKMNIGNIGGKKRRRIERDHKRHHFH